MPATGLEGVAKVQVRVQEAATYRLDEIYRYTRDHWGRQQADRYINGLFKAFAGIDTRKTPSRPIPAEFGIDGYFFRYERHFVYWRRLSNNDVGIVTILHEQMHQIDRFQEDFGL
ncbi:type II toxin-antitoxin system RelE/ParE family toxin [Pusillimonas sp. SM2304]|uniref:type II toxin-antitoxin system RelE/ParE family toxin n=1 Tax=Pusillimonas sp. SM2304 TaxID=3073241 RepID=UPI0028747097|nr:type II toxin-antitoxin system RelE/ParE family toxin [Pusillimonas sp. SM2304]MDS1139307.1 type II toxin-antitoxin system RelE/ParE family toxin [Pusillimonas sp. SM2304]